MNETVALGTKFVLDTFLCYYNSTVDTFPSHLINAPALEVRLTADAILAQAEGSTTPPFTDTSRELLAGLLENPFALQNAEHDKPYAVGFIWRLGVAVNMSRLVLSSVDNMSTTDAELMTSIGFVQGHNIAHDLLEENPNLLEHTEPNDTRAFWKLIGYNPTEDEILEPIMESLSALRPAKYLPPPLLDKMRSYRDSTATMHHEAQFEGAAIMGDTAEVVMHDPNERERELIEASVRVMLGVFLADHTNDPNDAIIAQQALRDFSARALSDEAGFQVAVEMLVYLDQENYANGSIQPAYQQALAQVAERSHSLDLSSLALENLTGLATALHSLEQTTQDLALNTLLGRVQRTLEDFESLLSIGDPDIDTKIVGPKDMLKVTRATSAQRELDTALQLLRDEKIPPASKDSVTEALQSEEFSLTFVEAAVKLVNAELDKTSRQDLLSHFDHTIQNALDNLPGDHPLRQNTLATLNRGTAYLTRFESGRRFVAQQSRNLVQTIFTHLENPNAWLNQQQHPDFIISTMLATLHDSLWNNLEYYKEGNGTDIVASYLEALTEVTNSINLHQAVPGTLLNLQETITGSKQLIKDLQTPNGTPYDDDPVEGVLRHYSHLS